MGWGGPNHYVDTPIQVEVELGWGWGWAVSISLFDSGWVNGNYKFL